MRRGGVGERTGRQEERRTPTGGPDEETDA